MLIKPRSALLTDIPTSVVIGDDKKAEFYPQIKAEFWSNQCNFSLRLNEDIDSATVEDVDGVVTWSKGSKSARIEPERIVVVLQSRPDSNVVEFTIQTKGLEFYLQDPDVIYAEFPDANVPDRVKYSYAVYHANKQGNEYKTGQAFMLYRPEAIDANGKQVWCDQKLDVENGTLHVTVPQDFLDTAVYPVEVA